jgi:hypothetical protein
MLHASPQLCFGHTPATWPMAVLRIEPSDIPAATAPASQLNELCFWYRTSMCILRRLYLQIEAGQGARKAGTCGKPRESPDTLWSTVCSKPRTGGRRLPNG